MQSRLLSLIEANVSTLIGFVISSLALGVHRPSGMAPPHLAGRELPDHPVFHSPVHRPRLRHQEMVQSEIPQWQMIPYPSS